MALSWFVVENGGNDYWTSTTAEAAWNGFGNIQTAITFRVVDDNYALEGYYYFWDSTENVLVPGGFALWACDGDPDTGTVVSGSVINAIPTPTVTGWQYVALDAPIPLTNGQVYREEFAASGGFYWVNNYGPFNAGGIINSPLEVFSDGAGTFHIPTTGGASSQGTFGEATNVAGNTYPNTGYEAGGPAIDVKIDIPISGPLELATTTLPDAQLNTQYKRSVSGGGGQPPYTYAVTSGALPSGVSLASNGKFSGIPAGLGSSTFQVTVTDAVSATASGTLTIKVTNPTFLAARDDFSRSDGPLGTNWADNTYAGDNGLSIVGDVVKGVTAVGGNHGDQWVKDYFTPDQFSQVFITTVPTTSDWIGPAVRMSDTGDSAYVAIIYPSGGGIELYQRVAGTYTNIGGYVVTFAVGDIVRLSVSGTTLKVNYNGTDVITVTGNSAIASGQPGIMASGQSGCVNNWTGGNGPGIVQVSYTSTDTSSGTVDTYSVLSQINNTGGTVARQDMRVLRPTSPNPAYSHSFLWLLPVEPGQGTSFGDSIATVHALNAENAYNMTCIQPGFPVDPWYGNSDLDTGMQQETFMLDLVQFALTDLYVTGSEKSYLIGFSKSGFGGEVLFMRNQTVFEKVASWDAACDYQTLDQYDGAATFGDQAGLDPYTLYDPHLSTWAASTDITTKDRIWLGAGINLIAPTSDYSDRLTADGILHTYTYVLTDSHNWAPNPGWVGPALAAILGSPKLRLLMGSEIF